MSIQTGFEPINSGKRETALEHKTVTLDGVKVHYVQAGEGPVVLLLHGLGTSLVSWCRNIQPLADAGFTVLAPDLPGHGDEEAGHCLGAQDGNP